MILPLWLSPHCSILLSFQYFHIRMESLLAWRCSFPKRPSSTQTPVRPFSMTSSSIKLPTVENLPLHIRSPNRQKHLRHPSRTRCWSHPNAPGSNQAVTLNLYPGGTPHLADTPRLVIIHPLVVTLHLGAILPLPAIHPPTTLPPSTNAYPPLPPPHLRYAGPGAGRKLPARRPAESARVDTFVHPRPHLTSPSHLHRHPWWSAAQSAPVPYHHSPDRLSSRSSHPYISS